MLFVRWRALFAGKVDCSAETSAPAHVTIGADAGAGAAVALQGSGCDVVGGRFNIKATGELRVDAGGNAKVVSRDALTACRSFAA